MFDNDDNVCRNFVADVFLLYHTGTGVKKGFQATLYVASTMQTATIEAIEGKVCSSDAVIFGLLTTSSLGVSSAWTESESDISLH